MELILGLVSTPLLGLTMSMSFALGLVVLLVAIRLYLGFYYVVPSLVLKHVSQRSLGSA